ncbi:phosphatase PAP2 family protein [Agreia pratensis]|uniref:phosphatase PAP2 family protein n=1 Tax=Agreia pratensis TaxID=150121 RepID=UPI00188C0D7F|nr:phosphatase PAP2 family protein [Agreia pratensis]MBF4633153.1 phosphatase PAP2 family protein [Agreia pratensis]
MTTELPGDKTQQSVDQKTRRVQRFWPLVSAFAVLVVAVLIGALVMVRGAGNPLGFDTEWMDEILEHRSPVWEVPSLAMNYLGGGVIGVFIVPLAIIAALCLFRRLWAALYFTVATIMSAGLVQLLKGLFGRARPEEILVHADFGSFPSGHVANATTMAVVLAVILRRTWVWVAGVVYVILMLLSRTYLGAHWLSDTVGGLLLGVGVAVIVWAPIANRLYRENERRHRFVLARSR